MKKENDQDPELPQYNKVTDCECPLAGFCERHQVHKSKHLHKLCQTEPNYFTQWEECRGPLQFCSREEKQALRQQEQKTKEEEEHHDHMVKKIKTPRAHRQAMNFVKAAAQHAMSGFNRVSAEEKEKRLEICKSCEFYIAHSKRCSKCGCFLEAKSGWSSQHCPIGKW